MTLKFEESRFKIGQRIVFTDADFLTGWASAFNWTDNGPDTTIVVHQPLEAFQLSKLVARRHTRARRRIEIKRLACRG